MTKVRCGQLPRGALAPEQAQQGAVAQKLPITLVVAVRDEERTIIELLESIAAQTCQPDEVILVDGGSSDGTVAAIEAQARHLLWVRVIRAGTATPGRGRNIGVAASRNDWVAFTDAGIRLEPTWLQRLWEAHRRQPESLVVYGNHEFDTRSYFEECAAVAYALPKRPTPAGSCRGPAIPSCLMHRQVLRAIGGFPDLRSGEDEIVIRAIAGRGTVTAWAPEATVWWRLRPDLWSTLERCRIYSFHNVLGGQQRHWHYPMARSYLPVAAGVVLGLLHSPRWYGLAAVTVAGRVALRLRRHAGDRRWKWLARPDRVGLVAALVLACDAAAAVGWWQARRAQRTALRGPA